MSIFKDKSEGLVDVDVQQRRSIQLDSRYTDVTDAVGFDGNAVLRQQNDVVSVKMQSTRSVVHAVWCFVTS